MFFCLVHGYRSAEMFRITPSLTSVCSIRYVAPPCTRMKNWWKSLSCWNIETSVPLSMVTCLFVCVSIAATSWPSSTWKTCVPRPLATLVDTVIFLCCVLVVFWEPGCVVLAVVSCRCMFMVWVAGNPSLRSRGGGTTIGFNIDIFARFGGGFSFPLPFRFLCFRTASDVISLSALFYEIVIRCVVVGCRISGRLRHEGRELATSRGVTAAQNVPS